MANNILNLRRHESIVVIGTEDNETIVVVEGKQMTSKVGKMIGAHRKIHLRVQKRATGLEIRNLPFGADNYQYIKPGKSLTLSTNTTGVFRKP